VQTKICSTCKKNQKASQFRRIKGYLVSPCHTCRREYQRQWAAQNPAKVKAAAEKWKKNHQEYLRLAARNRRLKTLEYARFRQGLKCLKCGEDHPACIDFHHRDPATKEFNISQGWRWGYPLERLKKEIEKCDILCSNCHRKHHWEEATKVLNRAFKNPPSFRPPKAVAEASS
jgi:hypothetical protein